MAAAGVDDAGSISTQLGLVADILNDDVNITDINTQIEVRHISSSVSGDLDLVESALQGQCQWQEHLGARRRRKHMKYDLCKHCGPRCWQPESIAGRLHTAIASRHTKGCCSDKARTSFDCSSVSHLLRRCRRPWPIGRCTCCRGAIC